MNVLILATTLLHSSFNPSLIHYPRTPLSISDLRNGVLCYEYLLKLENVMVF